MPLLRPVLSKIASPFWFKCLAANAVCFSIALQKAGCNPKGKIFFQGWYILSKYGILSRQP